jgi:ankyrin repeat protein
VYLCSWANTLETTQLWQLANLGDLPALKDMLYQHPAHVHLRAEDGRGPLFWAYEYEKWDLVDFLLERGADPNAVDAEGQKPAELLPVGAKRPDKDEL